MRQTAHVLTLHLPRCDNVYGVSPCTAGRVDSGTAQGGSSTTVTLRAGASAVDGSYNGMTLRLGDGRERRILDYVGASKVATVEKRWQTNLLLWSEAFDHATWTKRGTCVVTPDAIAGPIAGTIADRIDGIQDGDNDIFQYVAAANGTRYEPSIYVRRVSTSGVLALYNPVTAASGDWRIDMSLLPDEWTRITRSHPAVTVVAEFVGISNTCGFHFRRFSGAAAISLYAFGAQLEQATDSGDYIKTEASAVVFPDATSTYDIIDRPHACYNTRRTCRDPANFALGSHAYRFTGVDDPIRAGLAARPYLTRIELSPTQLDFEDGLGRRSDTRATSIDETDSDTEQDPYISERAAPAGGTFWRRWRARNLHYAGHPADLEIYEIIDGVWGTPKIEHYLIDAIEGPGKTGAVEIVLKDPTASLDATKTPVPTTGKLAVPLALNDLQAVLGTGEGEQYGSSGWFRHNDEVIRFTARSGDVLSWPDGTYRAQFGTTAQAGKVGDALQLCWVGIDESFAETVRRLFNAGGMSDAQLDLAGLQAEQENWLRGYDTLTYCIADPETTSTLVRELMVQAGMSSCWSSESQKQIFRVYAPKSPAALVPKVLTSEGHLLLDSVQVETLGDKRLTRVTVRYGLARATANLREPKHYLTGERTVMVDAESQNQYGDVREKEIFSRWFQLANQGAMRTLSRRMAARYVDAPEDIEFFVDPKDMDLVEGDVVDLITAKYVDTTGAPKRIRVIITRKHRSRRHGQYRARVTAFGDRRYAFIAPNGTPDYPNHAGYACIAANTGLMSDGTDGFRIW